MPEARPADALSVVSLAAGLAALALTLASVLPLMSVCFLPLAALSALTAFITGVVAAIRTTLKPELDGRGQALTGMGLALFWVGLAWAMWHFVLRHS
jgi:hypothetical protein